ncbi:MAG TPA: DUF2760 domain-containing protein [Lentisphaeria bacterium]|nr:MAG: hypothetical protein A2X47_02770 [Lentisphaerae bacterium GWF2_38_69]HBM15394.1 DUF2760 domain-containing protein [Lentisphaeria bacterium]
MNIVQLLGTSCPFVGLCDTEMGKGILFGALGMAVLILIISLIQNAVSKNKVKASSYDSKKIEESEIKIAELGMALAAEKESSSKKFDDGALYSLVLLQREGRFVDFIREDIKNYDDSQIGAAVRQIHAGCSKVLSENFNLKALYDKNNEGDTITLGENFNAEEVRLSGNVPSKGPYKGILRHKGWASASVSLPKKTIKTSSLVVCPAEIEIE